MGSFSGCCQAPTIQLVAPRREGPRQTRFLPLGAQVPLRKRVSTHQQVMVSSHSLPHRCFKIVTMGSKGRWGPRDAGRRHRQTGWWQLRAVLPVGESEAERWGAAEPCTAGRRGQREAKEGAAAAGVGETRQGRCGQQRCLLVFCVCVCGSDELFFSGGRIHIKLPY